MSACHQGHCISPVGNPERVDKRNASNVMGMYHGMHRTTAATKIPARTAHTPSEPMNSPGKPAEDGGGEYGVKINTHMHTHTPHTCAGDEQAKQEVALLSGLNCPGGHWMPVCVECQATT